MLICYDIKAVKKVHEIEAVNQTRDIDFDIDDMNLTMTAQ